MPQLSANWADALDPIVRKWWESGFKRRASLLDLLFNVQSSTDSNEEVSGIGAIGIDAWDNYENDGKVSEVDFDQGYKSIFTHREYPVDLSIERKLIDDNKHAQIMKISQRLGDSAALKREVDRASVFNNAFDSNFTGADGVELCDASHPYSPSKTGATQSNIDTLALTKDNVGTVREAMMAFTDDNGNKVAVVPDTLHVPPALEDEAIVIAQSLRDPDSANNAVNPQSGRWSVVVDHYLIDSNNWFMEDSVLRGMSLEWFDRVAIGIGLRDGDDRTLRAYWRAYMRYSFGWSDWRWVYGNNPSA